MGHYRHLHLFDPPRSSIEAFVEQDVILGSATQGAKAILQNWGLPKDIGRTPFLQRRLHLWFEVKPPEINVEDPWSEKPSFDPYAFTLPTRCGPVAPARWTRFRESGGQSFEGDWCDFMERIYFRQEVLVKYQGATGFDIGDNGSVRCRDYWGLHRSTHRIGNELLSTAIGDFAEGVPFEEWLHWQQYAVEPPSLETAGALAQEQTVPDAVNALVEGLHGLSSAFSVMANSLGMNDIEHLWRGSLDSLAARQLKWVYPAGADDDEFLKRATLASTLFFDGLHARPLRRLLGSIGANFHETFENPPKQLGSRNLLQRVTLVARLLEEFEPNISELPMLVKHAEGSAGYADQSDLRSELESVRKRVREEFGPLAFLYDLRTHGGLAHTPNKERVSAAAAGLGLPSGNWHRTDYLRLLSLVTATVQRVGQHLLARDNRNRR